MNVDSSIIIGPHLLDRDSDFFREQDIVHICAISFQLWPKLHILYAAVFTATGLHGDKVLHLSSVCLPSLCLSIAYLWFSWNLKAIESYFCSNLLEP